MSQLSFLIFILTLFRLGNLPMASATPQNCSSTVRIKSKSLHSYLAEVSFLAPKSVQGPWTAEMITDVPFTFLGGWGIWLTLDEEAGVARIRSKDVGKVNKGDRVSFRFRISWYLDEPKPLVSVFKWEEIVICEPTAGTMETIRSEKRKRYDEIRRKTSRYKVQGG